MKAQRLVEIIGSDFYSGVPDSQLKPLCNYLMDYYGIDTRHHIIAANEGNCTALAAGYYLATGRTAVVYMQNSGEGNVINPVASLLNDKVYGIPVLFIIGWRGEPGIPDEPQHIFQGEVTLMLLEQMGISYFVIQKETSEEEVYMAMEKFRRQMQEGKQAAFVIRKGALTYEREQEYQNTYPLVREQVIERIAEEAGADLVISTTGKASRELYEIRERKEQGHRCDFLTVGSMGHASSIALGVAVNQPHQNVWCIDGDGAAIMHMGALAVIGASKPTNLIHIILNNEAHETVGGMPTVGSSIDFPGVARACGYPYTVCVNDMDALTRELHEARRDQKLRLIEVKCAVGSRKDLGRPATAAKDNKKQFMDYIKEQEVRRQ